MTSRNEIIAEARSWLRTPFHHEARVKGAGVDCAQFLIGVYAAVGLIPEIKTEHYTPDWHLHRDEPRFVEVLKQYADPVAESLPGDVAMFGYGRQDAHAGIVIEWPRIVHAYVGERCVVESDVSTNVQLAKRFSGFWRLRALAEV